MYHEQMQQQQQQQQQMDGGMDGGHVDVDVHALPENLQPPPPVERQHQQEAGSEAELPASAPLQMDLNALPESLQV